MPFGPRLKRSFEARPFDRLRSIDLDDNSSDAVTPALWTGKRLVGIFAKCFSWNRPLNHLNPPSYPLRTSHMLLPIPLGRLKLTLARNGPFFQLRQYFPTPNSNFLASPRTFRTTGVYMSMFTVRTGTAHDPPPCVNRALLLSEAPSLLTMPSLPPACGIHGEADTHRYRCASLLEVGSPHRLLS